MAFHQPSSAPLQRPWSHPKENPTPSIAAIDHGVLDNSQEWILFSPIQTQPGQTQATFTESKTQITGCLSDSGSLNYGGLSRGENETANKIWDDEDLDSLDDSLHAFQEPTRFPLPFPLDDRTKFTILPAHDGLGTFVTPSPVVHSHVWKWELLNPQRHTSDRRRRKSNVQKYFGTVHDEDKDRFRMERIELWRIEQSKLLVEEIEKETRRRRSDTEDEPSRQNFEATDLPQPMAGLKVEGGDEVHRANALRATTLSEHKIESFWQRLTRRIIRNICIDESILSVIFGESLPLENRRLVIPGHINRTELAAKKDSSPIVDWQTRLLDRLSRELGNLAHQLHDHSGTFSSNPSTSTMDYAGIPLHHTADASSPIEQKKPHQIPSTAQTSKCRPMWREGQPNSSETPSEHAAQWGIEDEDQRILSDLSNGVEYWERTPNIQSILGYLQQRYTWKQQSTSMTKIDIATKTTPDSLRRAAVIRQHHPLVSRPKKACERHENRGSLIYQQICNASLQSHSLKRPGTSCGSLSTKKSRVEVSERSGNYWDFSESAGSGGIAGAWGEV